MLNNGLSSPNSAGVLVGKGISSIAVPTDVLAIFGRFKESDREGYSYVHIREL
jgi:hypothetical protein